MFSVEDKVRPYANILEVSPKRGLQVAAVVYADTGPAAIERAKLVAQFMDLQGSSVEVKKRLKLISRYAWAQRISQDKRHPVLAAIATLIMWRCAAEIEPRVMGSWLLANFGGSAGPSIRIMSEEEAI